MSSSQLFTPESASYRSVTTQLNDGIAALVSEGSPASSVKSVADVVGKMMQETQLSRANDVESMLRLAFQPQSTHPENEPAWYSEEKALVAHVAQIVGVDEDGSMIKMYNEIAKRLAHPTCAMQGYIGDLLPHPKAGVIPGLADLSTLGPFGNFDLTVISLGVDCFEILNLPIAERKKQLATCLEAICETLGAEGTLLIIDVEKSIDQPAPANGALINGYKSSGYHSSDITTALRSIGMNDVKVLDDNRFQWTVQTPITYVLDAVSWPIVDALPVKIPRTKDRIHHKWTCKSSASRKILYRVAETAQALFYVYREVAFDKLYAKVERKGSDLILYEGYYDDLFVPFPHSLFPDEKEKKAVLTYLACDDAYGYMHVVLKTMLEGISIKLQEAPAKFKARSPLKIRMYHVTGVEDLNEYQHEILLVTLKDTSVYVVDLAGAQYGYHEPVMPIELYEISRAVEILRNKSQRFGWQRQQMTEACTENGSWAVAIRCFNEILYQCFNDNVRIWQKLRMPLPAMLKGTDKDFRNIQPTFIKAVETALWQYKRLADGRGYFKV
ncbi:MAG: hypothetical protein Q9210_005618 [Variospora velana]